jgi:dTDP-4-dehydrorhamnose reductase
MQEFVILGSTGNVGSALDREFSEQNLSFRKVNRELLDGVNLQKFKKKFYGANNLTFINCVGFKPVDSCELEPEKSKYANYLFPIEIAEFIKNFTDSKMIQISTDFVFNGQNVSTPYNPNAVTKPVNIYGVHKANAEDRVISILSQRVRVVRISAFTGRTASQNTFVEKIWRQSLSTEIIKVIEDLRFSVSTSALLASDIQQVFSVNNLIQHSVNLNECSWYELAKEFFTAKSIHSKLVPVSVKSLNLAAIRPKYSVLESTSFNKNKILLDWKEAIQRAF